MRGRTRNRKNINQSNKKIIIITLLTILIAILAIFGIIKISKNKMPAEIGEQKQTQEEKEIPDDITINLVATGDIMCHKTNFLAAFDTKTGTYDFSPVFANVAKYISKADIAIREPRNNVCRKNKSI